MRKQLRDLCLRLGLPLVSGKSSDDLRRCLLSGLFMNTAQHVGEGKYKTVSGGCQLGDCCGYFCIINVIRLLIRLRCSGYFSMFSCRHLNLPYPSSSPAPSCPFSCPLLQFSTHQEVYIHPSSCLFRVKPHPPVVLYSELVQTAKRYMR